MKRVAMQVMQSALLIMAATWIGLSILFYMMQSSYIYYPDREIIATPADINLEYEEVFLQSIESEKIFGWYIPHPTPRATLIFFHGNGGNISHRLEKIRIFNQLGLSVFIFDYRGYGISTGEPSEPGTYADSTAAYRFIAEDKGISPEDIILYGESLGAAIGSWTAKEYPHGGLIIDSGFKSIPDVARYYYPFLPVNFIARIRYPTFKYLEQIETPLLVIHSIDDEIIPFNHGLGLYSDANEPKSFLQINGDHNYGFSSSGNLYKDGINTFISHWF